MRKHRFRDGIVAERRAVMSYDANADKLEVDFGKSDVHDLDEVIDDIFVFFDEEEPGRLLAVQALSPSLGRSEAWRSVLADYVGPTVMRTYFDAARRAASVGLTEVQIPKEEWDQLRSHAWPVAHRALRAKQGRAALPDELPRRGLDAIGSWLQGFTAQASYAYSARSVERIVDLPALNLELPREFARQCGVDAICFARFASPTLLELKLDLLPHQEPALEAVFARPPSKRARFEARGREAVAELDLVEPVESGRDFVVHFSRAR